MGVKFPQQSVIYLLLCLFGMGAFIFLGIVPSQKVQAGLEEKIAVTKMRIEEQKTLAPLYQALKQRANKQRAWILPFPAKSELPREHMDQISASVKAIAGRSNAALLSFAPVLNTLAADSKFMEMNLAARGDFMSLRKLITGLGGLPYVEHIEEIQIRQESEHLELRLKLWVALAQG